MKKDQSEFEIAQSGWSFLFEVRICNASIVRNQLFSVYEVFFIFPAPTAYLLPHKYQTDDTRWQNL